MEKGDDLWYSFCSFYEKDFSIQLEKSEELFKKHFNRWSGTKTAKQVCSQKPNFMDDIPVTSYEDYPILHTLGKHMESILGRRPKPNGITWHSYYRSLEEKTKSIFRGWLPYDYGICAKTTGSLGESKWFFHGDPFVENMQKEATAGIVLGCSEDWGETKLEYGDTVLNMGVPIPYMVGHAMKLLDENFNCFPPIEKTDELKDMRKKLNMIIKAVKEGKNIDVATAMASTFYMFSQAVVAPDELYKDYYQSMQPGIKKVILYLLYLKEVLTSKEIKKAKEVLSVKGLCTAGLDTKLYAEYLKEQFGVSPLNMYGSTEYGIVMHGTPDRRIDLMPSVRSMYFEFLNEKGVLYTIDELKKGGVYEIVGTPFGSMLFRYTLGDLLRVVEHRDDGMPIFTFESRKENMLVLRDYVAISENMAFEIMETADLENSNRWTFTKTIDPVEKLLLIMERDWELSAIEAEEKVFNVLRNLSPEFRELIKDFSISSPKQIVEVKYLKKGSFMRYSLQKMNQGVPIGQYKTPKILNPEKKDEIELLTSV